MDPGDMPMPSGPNSSTMNTNDMMMSMQMTFFWGKDVVVLFNGWPDKSLGMYILALCFVFFLGFAVEILSASPSLVLKTSATGRANPGVASSLSQAGVYAIRTALAYLAMLSVMSFNLGIFIVAVAGHAVGYFLVNLRKIAASQTNSSSTDDDPKV